MKKDSETHGKEVLITLTSVQSNGQEQASTELITAGRLEKIEEGFRIVYQESEATGYEGSETVLTCKGNTWASIERRGKASSHLIIEKDKKHHCHYGTPYGDFVIGIYAHSIDNALTEEGGKLYLKYTVDINSSYISDNEIYVTI